SGRFTDLGHVSGRPNVGLPKEAELLAADRKIWGTIGCLVFSGWTTPFTPPKTPKGKGKGGKQGKGLANKAKAEDWPSNWVYKAHGKVLCKRYQRNLCTVANCKFAHLCAVRGCGKDHCAIHHDGKTSRSVNLEGTLMLPTQPRSLVLRWSLARRLQEKFEPPQVLLLDSSGDLGDRCKRLANREAIPFLEPSSQPSEQESGLILQCLWGRSIIAVIASLPTIVPDTETAIALLQAAKASAAMTILTIPKDHVFLQSQELAACLHDSAFHMCPSPSPGDVLLASTRMPSWPCPDLHLLALEALGRVCNLPLRLGSVSELSYSSLLRASGPFVAHRPPICDGAGAPSSADHSLSRQSNISKASQAWLQWAHKSDLPKRVFAHISQSRPDHPLSAEEQSQALEILCSALNLDLASMAVTSPGQPFRLALMQALAQRIEDPDADLPSMLAEGVRTGVFSEIAPSGLWPPAKLQPLAQSGLEVCQGNWRPAEEDPDTVAALLADEEAAGWIQQVPGGLKAAKKRWPKGIAVGKLSLVKAEGRDPRLVLDSTVCQ
ncbi:unnamed protein product, partial [Symbiodinium necroappetens]